MAGVGIGDALANRISKPLDVRDAAGPYASEPEPGRLLSGGPLPRFMAMTAEIGPPGGRAYGSGRSGIGSILSLGFASRATSGSRSLHASKAHAISNVDTVLMERLLKHLVLAPHVSSRP